MKNRKPRNMWGGKIVEGERVGNKAVEEGKMEKRMRKMCTNKIQEQESGTRPRIELGTSRINARVLTSRPMSYFISSL